MLGFASLPYHPSLPFVAARKVAFTFSARPSGGKVRETINNGKQAMALLILSPPFTSFPKRGEIYPLDEGFTFTTAFSFIESMSLRLAIPWQVALRRTCLRYTSRPTSCRETSSQ
jgi:hypothetical protein